MNESGPYADRCSEGQDDTSLENQEMSGETLGKCRAKMFPAKFEFWPHRCLRLFWTIFLSPALRTVLQCCLLNHCEHFCTDIYSVLVASTTTSQWILTKSHIVGDFHWENLMWHLTASAAGELQRWSKHWLKLGKAPNRLIFSQFTNWLLREQTSHQLYDTLKWNMVIII